MGEIRNFHGVSNFFGQDNVRNFFGEDNVRKGFREYNVRIRLREDNVQREIMSICLRESNTKKRSGNSITMGANGEGVIMSICFRGSNVRESFFSGTTIFWGVKVSGSTSSLRRS